MSCDGVQALNPLCQTGDFIRSQSQTAVNGAFTSMADQFGQAAMNATTWLWAEIDRATSLDLSSPDLVRELGATSAIAGVLCLGLFLLQLTTAALRREPGALGRALKGLIISLVGSAGAIAATRVLLGAVDALSDGVVRYTMGTNLQGLGQKMAFTQLASVQNPAAAVLLAVIVLCAVVVVWVAMMVRKMTLLIAAVLAPLAFAGATADITHSWVRKWIEFVCAMVASKLLLVVIFGIGVSVLNGAGAAGPSATQGVTQLAVGSLILLMGGFAPWIAIRMFHFVGDSLHAAHATAAQAPAGARAVISAPQKVSSARWQARSLIGTPRATASSPGRPNAVPASMYASLRSPNHSTHVVSATSGGGHESGLPPVCSGPPAEPSAVTETSVGATPRPVVSEPVASPAAEASATSPPQHQKPPAANRPQE